jgi:hypothetical protein
MFGVLQPHLEYGMYFEQVRRYLDRFPRSQVRVFIYEEYTGRDRALLTETLEFLGVDPGLAPAVPGRHMEPRVPRLAAAGYFLKRFGMWDPLAKCVPGRLRPLLKKAALRPRASLAMAPEDRAYLREYYRDDIVKLAELLRRDLDAWLA